MAEKSQAEIYNEYTDLIKREAACSALLEVVKQISDDSSLSSSNKSDMLKSISKVYLKLSITKTQ